MTTRRAALGTMMLLVALMLAGCESAVAGSPRASSDRPDTADSTSPSTSERLSPSVEKPKDLRGIDPCEFVTPEQRAELQLTAPDEKEMSPWGEQLCDLGGSVVGISFSPNTVLGDGLDRAYRSKNSFDNFAETNVDGYPGVRVNFATQSCALIMGVSNEQTLNMELTRVSANAPGKGDPCGFAEEIMSEVIRNLPDA
ncbi:DUF3558 domain-containing protein [Actinophytocola oryzae]|uniref:Uncharacterized protein DUF3558 n=1 Tax=Actinophytocola oryzae TaxID=502181 RepID=A0A4R7V9H1_9PSEU|nr:DUF3558 domain-containing protein [Actinophytocola oryzae]TDV45569.1 uncharacterized protein DUF3558 [Actinophytocola oryzae]